MSKKSIGDGTAICINEVGAMSVRVFKVVNRVGRQVTIDLGNSEIYTIDERMIRAKRIILYKDKKGEMIIQNPDKWKNTPLRQYDIKELRFNLQNFGIQEGKAAIHRWTLPEGLMTKLTPLFKLLIIGIVIGVIGWAALKYSGAVFDAVIKSRTTPCSLFFPNSTLVPLGANVTAPIG